MESYGFLLAFAIILITTKVLGIISRKVNMPQVVGALLAGIIIGPSVLGIVTLDGSTGMLIEDIAEIGVIILMFSAGLETDLSELKKNGVAAFVTALCGVIFPIVFGAIVYGVFYHINIADKPEVLKAIFIGVVLSATSVSITVETLREMGKLQGAVGTTILGAAVIDDILGIIALTIVTSLKDPSVNIGSVLFKIVAYFVFIGIVAFIVLKGHRYIQRYLGKRRRTAIFSLVFCLLLAYASEVFFGIADITGAYFAGLILCNMADQGYINRRIEILSYLFFSPVFFASVGLKTSLSGFTADVLIFAVILLVVAILTKIVGCGVGAKLTGFDVKEATLIGAGMISRGEVALIVAQKGYQVGMLDDNLFAPIVLVVIVTTLITPVLLKALFAKFDPVVETKEKLA